MRSLSRQAWTGGTGLLCAAAIAAAAAVPATGSAQTINARIGNCTIGDAVHEHIKLWKDELEKRSQGRISGELFINCQLGSIPRQIEGIQMGTQDFFATPPNFAVGVEPRYQVADAPGMFDGFEHAHRAITHPIFRDAYMQLGRDKGLTPVSIWVAGSADYISLTPLRRLEDWRGKKIRVLGTRLEAALVGQYAATGVPVTFTEIVPALQMGMIDAARTAPLVMVSAKMYAVAKHVTIVHDGFIPLMAWVSSQFLRRLPADLRDLVFEIGKDLDAKMLPIALGDQNRGFDELRKNGVEVIELSKEEHSEILSRARRVTQEHLTATPEMKALFDKLSEAAEKTRGG